MQLKDSRRLARRESILPDEPATVDAIVEKFMNNGRSKLPESRACEIREAVLNVEQFKRAHTLSRMLAMQDGGRDCDCAPRISLVLCRRSE